MSFEDGSKYIPVSIGVHLGRRAQGSSSQPGDKEESGSGTHFEQMGRNRMLLTSVVVTVELLKSFTGLQ
jgi:hypothetical protein